MNIAIYQINPDRDENKAISCIASRECQYIQAVHGSAKLALYESMQLLSG